MQTIIYPGSKLWIDCLLSYPTYYPFVVDHDLPRCRTPNKKKKTVQEFCILDKNHKEKNHLFAYVQLNPPADNKTTYWCGQCQDYFDIDHYPDNTDNTTSISPATHAIGLEYGLYGRLLACEALLRRIVVERRLSRSSLSEAERELLKDILNNDKT